MGSEDASSHNAGRLSVSRSRRNSGGACGGGLSAISIPRSSIPCSHPPATPSTVTKVCNCSLRTLPRRRGPHCTRTTCGRKTMQRHTSTATTRPQRRRRRTCVWGDAVEGGCGGSVMASSHPWSGFCGDHATTRYRGSYCARGANVCQRSKRFQSPRFGGRLTGSCTSALARLPHQTPCPRRLRRQPTPRVRRAHFGPRSRCGQ